MTQEEKVSLMKTMLGEEEEYNDLTLSAYLDFAKSKILTHRYPFGTTLVEVEPKYEYAQIELAIALYNQRGAEGENKHSENGVSRSYRDEIDILSSIPRVAGIPS